MIDHITDFLSAVWRVILIDIEMGYGCIEKP
jgi:hypothetical protein